MENLDFDFDLDFGFETKYTQVDICGLVNKMKSKKRKMMNISRETKQLEALIEAPPKQNECFKMLSVGGGFSSLAIISFIAKQETIEQLYVSTFRIGKSHFQELIRLKKQKKLGTCHFITSQTQERVDDKAIYKGQEYNYYDYIVKTCEEFNWRIKSFDNHSKLLLMKTPKNYYVIETSSNLNENPKMEQFNWENDKQLYNWYLELFIELLK